jgi:protein O-GlcNAc transferase
MVGKTFADAVMYWRNGRRTEAEDVCRALVAEDGKLIEPHRLLAEILASSGRMEAALAACRRVADLAPLDELIWQRMGGLLLSLSRPQEALAAFDQAISRAPAFARAHAGRGMTLIGLGRDAEALEALARAVQIDPKGAAPLMLQAGYQMLQLGRPDAALATFARLIELQPDSEARHAHAMALVSMGRFAQVAPELAALHRADPGADYLAGISLHARLQCCGWEGFDEASAAITQRVRHGERADAPLTFIVHNGSPADQLTCARTYAAHKCAADAPAVSPAPRANSKRLRIAYLSADFRDHAVSQCLVEVLEAHDRTRLETYAFSTGPDDGSPLRRRIEGGVEHFLQVAALSDRDIAARMALLAIDIAVDLGGHSAGGRTRVLAYRAAPVQVSFLGFPGTTGTDYIDYLIADERVLPEAQQVHYSEQAVYLPDTCFPTPRRPDFSLPTRAQAGLPPAGFVYCAFNGPHKISPHMFALWMRVLRAVPDSVLWLRDASRVVRDNLAHTAEQSGVARSRLIFAERTATRVDHLARFALADVFLDTYPYGAHTTASEALLGGVPVITLKGAAFASRVAFSLLCACGLQLLAADSAEQYQALAVDLGLHPHKALELKRELGNRLPGSGLFAPQRFSRQLETAYMNMHERRLKGERPSPLRISPDRSAENKEGAL